MIQPLSCTGPKFLEIVQGHRVQLDKTEQITPSEYVPITLVLLSCVALGKPDGSVLQTSLRVEHDPDSSNGISGKQDCRIKQRTGCS